MRYKVDVFKIKGLIPPSDMERERFVLDDIACRK